MRCVPAGEDGADAGDDVVRFARLGRALRLVAPLVVVGWVAVTVALTLWVPALQPTSQRSGLGGALSTSSPAIRAEEESVERFELPLLAQVVVVQHRAAGLPLSAELATVADAARLDLHLLPGLHTIAGAIPISNGVRTPSSAAGAGDPSRAVGTTALTLLFFEPSVSPSTSTRLADSYARRYLSAPGDGTVGVTGVYPAENAQGDALGGSLTLVELLSVGLVVLVVGLTFRSVAAPVLTLLAAGLAYECSQRVLAYATVHLGVTVPAELDPIIVVLLLGLMTDYCVFYLTSYRRRLGSPGGRHGKTAVLLAAGEVTPIVAVAGLTVALGVALIEGARLSLFRSLAPGLAITVIVTVVVAITFVPASLSLLGRAVLWPSRKPPAPARARLALQRAFTRRALAPLLLVVVGGALVYVSLPVGGLGLGLNLINGLPKTDLVNRAAANAAAGFAPGAVAPTLVLVSGRGADDVAALARLQARIAAQPGVAGVVGPADKITDLPLGVFVSSTGPTARYLVVLANQPLGTTAISRLQHLESVMPALMAASGLGSTHAQYAGDTAISSEITGPALSSLLLVAAIVVLADVALLGLYLRSLVVPIVLGGASLLVVTAALGITMVVVPAAGGPQGFTFYVPFAAEVLLLSFGSDYNLFLTGEIWRLARTRPFRAAIGEGGATASSAINVAGLTLALSFAVLFVVPLTAFRELALAMAGGLLIDTFLVRFVLVPAALSLIGRRGAWPRHLGPTPPAGE